MPEFQQQLEDTLPVARLTSEAAKREIPVVPISETRANDGTRTHEWRNHNPRARVDKYFTKPFADLIWKYSQSVSAEETGFDADPLYNAQDLKLKNFAVGRADVKGESATVPVTFTNFGERVSINYKLRSINNVWKIDDIMYSPKDGLAAWLKERIGASTKAKASPGEFEGRYNVGDTTCTVEFKNKGYAVRWAKGSGEEYFSFMGGTTFASSTVESEANRFVFDDENYNFGTFFRADGKTFPVSRSR
ncbi:DUF3828 domain-containing protein [Leptolyngbya sp. 7M]|uniref:DUF3828 domain-containing protein n=1 Tax=Leptolyngbya sp. 7M TaxID=2812896 RepID=UPI001B8BCD31|nr:DUF3828 domain-containing protein [Leptolyngbya sp. 7M]QYO67163.1 YbjP/YqhG family protein [Leptolyngbya sp. 7M]